MNDEIKKRFSRVLANELPEAVGYAGSNMIQDGVIDSFDVISLVEALDREFAIEIPAPLVTAENFATPAHILDMICQLLGTRSEDPRP